MLDRTAVWQHAVDWSGDSGGLAGAVLRDGRYAINNQLRTGTDKGNLTV